MPARRGERCSPAAVGTIEKWFNLDSLATSCATERRARRLGSDEPMRRLLNKVQAALAPPWVGCNRPLSLHGPGRTRASTKRLPLTLAGNPA